MLVRVLYASEMTRGVTSEEVLRLVGAARRRNRQLDITGALLRCDHNFVQVIEGNQKDVMPMLASIQTDHRHYNMRIFIEESIETRLFDAFAMGFVVRLDMLQSLQELRAGDLQPHDFLDLMLKVVREDVPFPLH